MLSRQTFHKDERLCSRKLIEKVWKDGKIIVQFPFRIKWMKTELNTKYPAQIVISVPKKTFKRAVDRNLIKRLIREAYRKNKSNFYNLLSKNNWQCALLLEYIGKTIPQYPEVEKGIIITLQKFEEDIIAGSR